MLLKSLMLILLVLSSRALASFSSDEAKPLLQRESNSYTDSKYKYFTEFSDDIQLGDLIFKDRIQKYSNPHDVPPYHVALVTSVNESSRGKHIFVAHAAWGGLNELLDNEEFVQDHQLQNQKNLGKVQITELSAGRYFVYRQKNAKIRADIYKLAIDQARRFSQDPMLITGSYLKACYQESQFYDYHLSTNLRFESEGLYRALEATVNSRCVKRHTHCGQFITLLYQMQFLSDKIDHTRSKNHEWEEVNEENIHDVLLQDLTQVISEFPKEFKIDAAMSFPDRIRKMVRNSEDFSLITDDLRVERWPEKIKQEAPSDSDIFCFCCSIQ